MIDLTVHTIVRNEDNWIWYALNSVLPFASSIIVFDTGSEDKTVEIIKSIKSAKIIFEEKGKVDKKELVSLRNEQILRTKSKWILIVDGDEIWPKKELEKLLGSAESTNDKVAAMINKSRNCIGDIYHYLPESAGRYNFGGVEGNFNIRLIRKTDDLKVQGEYPLESYSNKDGPIEKQNDNLQFVDSWCLHTSFLKRSSSDLKKFSGSLGGRKIPEKGIKMNINEVPEIIRNGNGKFDKEVLRRRSLRYEFLAFFTTPLISLKRMI